MSVHPSLSIQSIEFAAFYVECKVIEGGGDGAHSMEFYFNLTAVRLNVNKIDGGLLTVVNCVSSTSTHTHTR